MITRPVAVTYTCGAALSLWYTTAMTARLLLAPALALALVGCGPQTPTPATVAAPLTTTAPTSTPTSAPLTTTTPPSSATHPTTTKRPAKRATTAHRATKPRATKSSRYSCEPDQPPKFDGNIITNKSCGYTDSKGQQRDQDPWIDGQLQDARERGEIR